MLKNKKKKILYFWINMFIFFFPWKECVWFHIYSQVVIILVFWPGDPSSNLTMGYLSRRWFLIISSLGDDSSMQPHWEVHENHRLTQSLWEKLGRIKILKVVDGGASMKSQVIGIINGLSILALINY